MDEALPYTSLVHAALRSLVRGALAHAARHGLPGDHHFYITLRTDHPGVAIPARLKAQYPEEMTIVLQHKFWDLKVQEDAFTVGLSFNGVPASLTVPFAALTGFADPAMRGNPFAEVALMLDKDRGFALRLPAEGMPGAPYDGQDAPEASGEATPAEAAAGADAAAPPPAAPAEAPAPQVVSLDAFRKRGPEKPK
jgi:hypothetical protein